jgi:GTP pyrophosphokinase
MRASKAAGSGSGILVVGVDRLMTGLARCCKPAPPDPIAASSRAARASRSTARRARTSRASARASPSA